MKVFWKVITEGRRTSECEEAYMRLQRLGQSMSNDLPYFLIDGDLMERVFQFKLISVPSSISLGYKTLQI